MKDNEISHQATWEKAAIGQHFGQEATNTTNRLGQEGFSLLVPPTGEPLAAVTLFPSSQTIRVRTRNADIYVRNAAAPLLSPSGMHIESEDGGTQMLVTRSGGVALQSFPPSGEPLESPVVAPSLSNGERLDSPSNAVPDGVQPDSGASPDASGTEQAARTERQPKVSWTGYVSNIPDFAAGKDGTPRANFIVSEHLEDERTVFHKVYTTRKEAVRLQEAGLGKGQRIKVSGYRQERERQNRDGSKTPEVRVYAAHVTIYKRDDASDSPTPEQS